MNPESCESLFSRTAWPVSSAEVLCGAASAVGSCLECESLKSQMRVEKDLYREERERANALEESCQALQRRYDVVKSLATSLEQTLWDQVKVNSLLSRGALPSVLPVSDMVTQVEPAYVGVQVGIQTNPCFDRVSMANQTEGEELVIGSESKSCQADIFVDPTHSKISEPSLLKPDEYMRPEVLSALAFKSVVASNDYDVSEVPAEIIRCSPIVSSVGCMTVSLPSVSATVSGCLVEVGATIRSPAGYAMNADKEAIMLESVLSGFLSLAVRTRFSLTPL